MDSVSEDLKQDELPLPEPTIPMLVDRIGAALSRLLRLVRPAEAGPIRETVDELSTAFAELLETALRQAQAQSATTFAPILERLEQVEARLAELEGGQARQVGGDPDA